MTANRRRNYAVDNHVAAQLRRLRIERGLTQTDLADRIGVTYQQEHKYERGINRISCGQLYVICQAFDIPIGHLFEGLDSKSKPIVIEESDRLRMSIGKMLSKLDRRALQVIRQVAASHLPEETE